MSKFIEIPRLRDYHTSSAEEAAILAEVQRENPSAYECVLVEGGVHVFETAEDYETWKRQV